MASLTEFEVGALVAVSTLISCYDEITVAANILNELGMKDADCSSLDDYDKEQLRKIQGEMGGSINLGGLTR